jgi:hypothetical protein
MPLQMNGIIIAIEITTLWLEIAHTESWAAFDPVTTFTRLYLFIDARF